jgi:hypothetical protein
MTVERRWRQTSAAMTIHRYRKLNAIFGINLSAMRFAMSSALNW